MVVKRLSWIDIAKGLCIILVVFVHTWSYQIIVNFSFAFFMQMFFYIDGIILAEKRNGGVSGLSFKFFLKKKWKMIMRPYFAFSVISIFLDLFIKGKSVAVIDLADTISFKGIAVLWFLPAMFLSVILTELFFKSNICRFIKSIIVIIAGVIPLILGNYIYYDVTACDVNEPFYVKCVFVLLRGMIGFTFTVLGYVIHGYYLHRLSGKFDKSRFLPCIVGIALMVLIFFTSQINSPSNMSSPITPNILLYYFNAIGACIGTALISMGIREFGLLEYCGYNSLIIMFTHLNLYLLEISTTIGLKLGGIIPIKGITYVLIATILTILIWISIVLFKPIIRILTQQSS